MELKSKLMWLVMLLVSVSAWFAGYHMASVATPLKTIGGVVWLAVVIGCFLLTDAGGRTLKLVIDAKQELMKVVWPTRQETMQTTMIIGVVVAIVSIVLWLIDNGLIWLVGKVTALT